MEQLWKRKSEWGFTPPFLCRAKLGAERAGFTLLELMVVVAIFAIIIGASYALLNTGRTGSYFGDTKIELQEDTRQAMDAIISELSESVFTKVTVGSGGNSITFQTPVEVDESGSREDTDLPGESGYGEPDFYLENTWDSVNKRVRWGAYLRGEDHATTSSSREGRWIRLLYVEYEDEQGRIRRELRRRVLNSDKSETIEDFPLADNIQSVSFVRVSNEVIRINIEARKLTIDRHPVIYSLSTEVHLRSNI